MTGLTPGPDRPVCLFTANAGRGPSPAPLPRSGAPTAAAADHAQPAQSWCTDSNELGVPLAPGDGADTRIHTDIHTPHRATHTTQGADIRGGRGRVIRRHLAAAVRTGRTNNYVISNVSEWLLSLRRRFAGHRRPPPPPGSRLLLTEWTRTERRAPPRRVQRRSRACDGRRDVGRPVRAIGSPGGRRRRRRGGRTAPAGLGGGYCI